MTTTSFVRSSLMAAIAISGALALSAMSAEAAGRASGRATVANPNGGATSVGGAAVRGPNGGAAARGRAAQTDGQGNAKYKRGGAAKGPNGGYGASSASGQRNADRTYSGQRNTAGTGPNGNSYNGGYNYSSGNGVTRNANCTNASGAVVPCPGQ